MALEPPGRVQIPNRPVVETSTKTVFLVSSFRKRRKVVFVDVVIDGGRVRMVRSIMLVGE